MKLLRWNLTSLLVVVAIAAVISWSAANFFNGELLLREYRADRVLTEADLQLLAQLEKQHTEIQHADGQLGDTHILVVAERRYARQMQVILQEWAEQCVPPCKIERLGKE